ncbi:MAG: Cof-type HAD-IIB family hydrolase [Lachnospiraceae bacterium]|nr:Cof-type HAD-IIB family hydrolase [Lachnospiraceae bacterium]
MNKLGINERKALVLDIDGTLTNSKKEITPKTAAAIKNIMNMGHAVILASGRPTPGMMRYESELELAKYGGYLLSFNGARVKSCADGEIIYQKTLPENIPGEIYEFAKEKDAGIISYYLEGNKYEVNVQGPYLESKGIDKCGNYVISAFEPDEYVLLEARINQMKVITVYDFKEFINYPVNKVLITAPGVLAAGYEKELLAKYGDSLSIYRSEEFFLEVMPQNVSKADTLDAMLDIIGVKRENTICCGDGFNDISMIKYAGVGVAMANAKDEVKENADFITGSNDEDGLVTVIDKFILNRI